MTFNLEKKYIDEKLVDEKEHPEFPLFLYNYTPQCQYSKAWDDVTKMCRGLIVHKETKEIIARPFTKFFNYEEHAEKGDTLPNEIPKVYTKLDGSLGILYWWNDEPYIATRGSFTSDQARWATDYIKQPSVYQWVQKLDRGYTHLFEIIYPENRIVISYDFSGLVHLASVHIETGKTKEPDSDFPMVSSIPFTSYQELKSLNKKNEEGFVLHYPQVDFRVKVKFDDYVKLHKIVTGLSQIGIWEMLKEGIDPTTQDIPDEMYAWLDGIVTDLCGKFIKIENECLKVSEEAKQLPSRKEQAIFITKHKHTGVIFSMLDGKEYAQAIWKLIRPKGSVTFRNDIDA